MRGYVHFETCGGVAGARGFVFDLILEAAVMAKISICLSNQRNDVECASI